MLKIHPQMDLKPSKKINHSDRDTELREKTMNTNLQNQEVNELISFDGLTTISSFWN